VPKTPPCPKSSFPEDAELSINTIARKCTALASKRTHFGQAKEDP
jgi:hypothetical protein